MTMTEDAVRAGAAELDQRLPGWEHHIQLHILDISNPERCITGQLRNARLATGFSGLEQDLGFCGDNDRLTAEWTQLIYERVTA